MSKWEAAFREIYGRAPTRKDFTYASTIVRKELHKNHGIPSPKKKVVRTPVKIKRPPMEEVVEFTKPKRRKLFDSIKSQSFTSPVKVPVIVPSSSPLKGRYFSEIENLLDNSIHEAKGIMLHNCNSYRSPIKRCKLLKSDNFDNIAAIVCDSIEDVNCKEGREDDVADLEQWPDETEKVMLIEGTSSQNQSIARTAKSSEENSEELTAGKKRVKKPVQNFVRLNMKKKTFVRGYVSADFKRKKRRWERLKRYKK